MLEAPSMGRDSLSFLTVESSCVKLWVFSNGQFIQQKRIQIKQTITQAKVSELSKFIIILGKNGRVLILDYEGEFVTCISMPGVFFSTIGTTNDKILLGTDRGIIHAYSLSTL